MERKAWVASFGRPKMTPQSLLASPTGLSPYLRFGCLSTRLFYHALSDLYRKVTKQTNSRYETACSMRMLLDKEVRPAPVPARTAAVARVLLLRSHQKPEL